MKAKNSLAILLVFSIQLMMFYIYPDNVVASSSSTATETSVFLLKTWSGKSYELSSIEWEITSRELEYTQKDPKGVPTARGLEIYLRFVSKVEFGTRSDKSWPVTITLLDDSTIKEELGFKAQKMNLQIS